MGNFNKYTEGVPASHVIDCHGMSVDAMFASIDKFLDSMYFLGVSRALIIHGMGSGKLSKSLPEYLSKSVYVKEFYLGGELGLNPGITTVILDV